MSNTTTQDALAATEEMPDELRKRLAEGRSVTVHGRIKLRQDVTERGDGLATIFSDEPKYSVDFVINGKNDEQGSRGTNLEIYTVEHLRDLEQKNIKVSVVLMQRDEGLHALGINESPRIPKEIEEKMDAGTSFELTGYFARHSLMTTSGGGLGFVFDEQDSYLVPFGITGEGTSQNSTKVKLKTVKYLGDLEKNRLKVRVTFNSISVPGANPPQRYLVAKMIEELE